jgi:hypothetical protein
LAANLKMPLKRMPLDCENKKSAKCYLDRFLRNALDTACPTGEQQAC